MALRTIKLKTIKEHEDEVFRRLDCKKLTGIECPSCKEELQFENPSFLLISSPPQTHVKCFNCGFADRIFV